MFIIFEKETMDEVIELKYFNSITSQPLTTFGPISRVNFLVGANNTGKSNLLRILSRCSKFKLTSNELIIEAIDVLKNQLSQIDRKIDQNSFIQIKGIKYDKKGIERGEIEFPNNLELYRNSGYVEDINLNQTFFKQLENYILQVSENSYEDFNLFISKALIQIKIGIDALQKNNREKYLRLHHQRQIQFSNSNPHKIGDILESMQPLIEIIELCGITYLVPSERKYIPILRTLTTLLDSSLQGVSPGHLNKNIYEGTVLTHYFKGNKENKVKICTGLELYNDILFVRNNEKKIRKGFEAFEVFLSRTFFAGREVDIVAKITQDHNDRHISFYLDEIEHEIYKFGDGIQSIILLLYPIFTASDNSTIFIEEPELNMHPGLQRVFLTTLLNDHELIKKNLKYYITTHSNHLLDLTLTGSQDISIFAFKEVEHLGNKVKFVANVKDSDIDSLELLGVNNSSVYLANCSIWVEGHTDTLFLRSFLNAYEEEFKPPVKLKEDLHYAFFEYGGSNVSHYLFGELNEEELDELDKIKARFLANRILLIADNDLNKNNKHERLKGFEGKNFNYYSLPTREIENLLSPNELKSILPTLHSNLKEIDWNKLNFEEEKYETEYLGKYLKQKLGTKFPDGMKAASGTLETYYKNKLAFALNQHINWKNMSEKAKTVTKVVYDYIIKNNNLL